MIASIVGSPRRSSRALVATVVPILTASIALAGISSPGARREQLADPLERRVVVLLRIVGQELVHADGTPSGVRADHVGERAAPVDPELPPSRARALDHHRSVPCRQGEVAPRRAHSSATRSPVHEAAANDLPISLPAV